MWGGNSFSLFTCRGGVPGLRFLFGGGTQVSDFSRWGPGLRFFWGGGVLVSVKGNIFDTRFGLMHVQTGKKNFVEDPPPPQVKGKIFDTRFGLRHVQTGKKIFVKGPLPPRNSKKLLWLCRGRYASCVHAGGLSCYTIEWLNLRFKLMINSPPVASQWNHDLNPCQSDLGHFNKSAMRRGLGI